MTAGAPGTLWRIAAGLVAAGFVCGCAARPELRSVTPAPDWEEVFVRTSGWTGADGAATVVLPRGRVLWLFGDTFIGPVIDGAHAAGTTMVNNTIAVTNVGIDPPRQVEFLWGGTEHRPEAWTRPEMLAEGADTKSEWFWPASGGVLARDASGQERLVLFMTRLSRIDESQTVWNFRARGTTALTVHNPGDPPEAWRTSQATLTTLRDGGRVLIWGSGALVDRSAGGPVAYILGVDETNVFAKTVVLARAPAQSVERFDSWRFWNGRGWSEHEADAAPIAHDVSSEVSLHRVRVAGGHRLILVYSEGNLGRGIWARTAARPEGPWSEAVRLYECPEPAAERTLMAYSAKAHPELSRRGELLVSYCVNSTDFGDVLRDAAKYRPRFVRVPISMLPPPP